MVTNPIVLPLSWNNAQILPGAESGRAQKDYGSIWSANPSGFGPPSPEMLTYCHGLDGRGVKNIRIVDVASGNGRYAIEFAKAGFGHVTAIELSQQGCDLIRARNTEIEGSICVQQANILECGIEKKFDIVFSSGLLDEFETKREQIAAVHKMQDMTAGNGMLVLRYCLYISNRNPPERVDANLVYPLFDQKKWRIIDYSTDDQAFLNAKSTIRDSENVIQRQTIVCSLI